MLSAILAVEVGGACLVDNTPDRHGQLFRYNAKTTYLHLSGFSVLVCYYTADTHTVLRAPQLVGELCMKMEARKRAFTGSGPPF